MHKLTTLTLAMSSILLSSNINAATKVADARGNAMGNTGVASADYLTAPFYNPALATSYKSNDDFGFFIAVDVAANDPDDAIETIDDLQSFMDDYDQSTASNSDVEVLEGYLDDLNDNTLAVSAGVGGAIALPTELVSTNLFARGYTEVVAATYISDDSTSSDDATAAQENYENSEVQLLAFGYVEVGLAFAKEFKVAGEKVSFGVTPKYQQMTTYAQKVTIDDFDVDDYDESENTKNAFNVDLGAAWYIDDFRAAIAIKDLFSQKIKAKSTNVSDTYNLDTQITLGVAYTNDYFVAAIDADLTKQSRFENIDDDTQFIRFGVEGNAWGWAQLRAGYEMDLQDTLDNSFTAGLGFSPFDLVSLDIAGAYAGENQLGASVGVAVTF
ncbi:conjugal transfer protein TraF [Psychromonas sp. PT13]|uniref:conjugal transfer protein TraF n=1 Tax=Psychromonas sp. PT13 TaxID=3439547 RepID=UPI003EB8ECEB